MLRAQSKNVASRLLFALTLALAATALPGATGGCASSSEPAPRIPFREPAVARASVWLDMDPAIGEALKDVDDGWAFVHARATLGERLVGISLGYGNIDDLARQQAITTQLQLLFPGPPLPVFLGAERPEDLGRDTPASTALAEQLGYERLTILALGRLTTVAHVIASHPELRARIDDVVVVGGRRLESEPGVGKEGRILPDSNLAADMAAVRILLESGVPLTLAPTDLALGVAIDGKDLEALAARGGAARYLSERSHDWLEIWQAVLGAPGFSPFDSLASLVVSEPGKVNCESLPADIVELPDRSFRGSGLPIPRLVASAALTSARRVRFCSGVSADAKATLLAALPGP